MFSELIGMESWIIYDFFYFIPIPLNRNKLSQINIYYVNFDKPIIISTFVAIILAIVSHWAARIILLSGNPIETLAFLLVFTRHKEVVLCGLQQYSLN